MMKDKIAMWLAYKIPKRIIYWSSIRLISFATVGQYSNTIVPELTAIEALKRWDNK